MSVDSLNALAILWFLLMLAGVFGVVVSSQAGIRLIISLFIIVSAIRWVDYVDQWHDAKSAAKDGSGTVSLSDSER